MITNEWIPGTGDIADALALRRAVFVEEQGVPEDIEMDEADAQAMHLVIYDDGQPVAAGRVWFDGSTFRLGRCAVQKNMRGRGIGDLLVKLLAIKALEFADEVHIHAQTSARAFYERYGFSQTGDEFDEAGIAHVPMTVTRDALVLPSRCGAAKR